MHDLPLPNLLDHMGGEDRPSCNEEEKDAKRQRSASTTPRSARGTQPYDYDRVMGVTSVGSQEWVRFGEEVIRRQRMCKTRLLTHSSEELDRTHDEDDMYHDANPGIGEMHGGYGSASLRECLGRLVQPTTTTSATCHFGEGVGDIASRMTDPSQVMSPNVNQIPSQASTSARDLPPEDTSHQSKERECKEEVPKPKPEQEQFDAKEEQGEDSYQYGPQTRCIPLRELREGQEALSTRVSSVEESVHHVREYMRRIILIEQRVGVNGGVIDETLRECKIRLDQCTAGLAYLNNRMRVQEQHHEVSEHESSDENRQTTDGRPRPRRAAPKPAA